MTPPHAGPEDDFSIFRSLPDANFGSIDRVIKPVNISPSGNDNCLFPSFMTGASFESVHLEPLERIACITSTVLEFAPQSSVSFCNTSHCLKPSTAGAIGSISEYASRAIAVVDSFDHPL